MFFGKLKVAETKRNRLEVLIQNKEDILKQITAVKTERCRQKLIMWVARIDAAIIAETDGPKGDAVA
jgi:hypothetical protein